MGARVIKRKRRKLTRADAMRLSGGMYWIIGRETDEDLLKELGVEVGPKQVDTLGRVKRAKGLVTWGQCKIPDLKRLQPYWRRQFFWGPDCPDHIAKDLVRSRTHLVKVKGKTELDRRPNIVAEVDWLDPEFRKKVGADEEQ